MTGVNGIDGVELTGVFGVNAGQGELCSAEPVKSLARRAIQSCGFFSQKPGISSRVLGPGSDMNQTTRAGSSRTLVERFDIEPFSDFSAK